MTAVQASMPKHQAVDDEVVMRSVLAAPLHADGDLADADAVSGASLGVEGIIERGRAALTAVHQ